MIVIFRTIVSPNYDIEMIFLGCFKLVSMSTGDFVIVITRTRSVVLQSIRISTITALLLSFFILSVFFHTQHVFLSKCFSNELYCYL
jgi:ABC-type tungstate transport system substrate-binding protein